MERECGDLPFERWMSLPYDKRGTQRCASFLCKPFMCRDRPLGRSLHCVYLKSNSKAVTIFSEICYPIPGCPIWISRCCWKTSGRPSTRVGPLKGFPSVTASALRFYERRAMPYGYILWLDSDRYFDRKHYQPVSTGKKEVIAGTLAKYGDHIK